MDSDDYDLSTSRRSSLAISALLNDDSIDPVASPSNRQLTPGEKKENRKTWHGFASEDVLPKAKRKRISAQQCNRLMDIFQQTDTPSSEVREHLAEELDMTKREVQVWFQNRRAKASRARAVATTVSNSNHNVPAAPSSRYDPFTRTTDHQHYRSPAMPPPAPPPIKNNHHQPQPFIPYTPPSSRRASTAFSDTSTIPPSRSATLQPIAPMPPSVPFHPSSITMPPSFTSPYNQPTSPTPPHVQPIAPRSHSIHQHPHQGFENVSMHSRNNNANQSANNKRPKSVIGVLNTTL